VAQPGCHGQAIAHVPHLLRERADVVPEGLAFKVPEHLMAVMNGVNAGQPSMKERLQVIELATRCNGADDLVNIQVAEKLRLIGLIGHWPDITVEENAPEGHGLSCACRAARASGAVAGS
jgi:hypothetical protein